MIKVKDDLDMLVIYWHVSVLGNLEFQTINFPKTQVVKCCAKIVWFAVAKSIKIG